MNIIGEVEGRNCVIMDDMVDTAGTLVKAAEVLKERGAKKVGILHAPGAVRPGNRPHHSSSLDELVVTDTIPLSEAPSLRQDPSTDLRTAAGQRPSNASSRAIP
jgi:ribose-phosphate pyrophosphokinase